MTPCSNMVTTSRGVMTCSRAAYHPGDHRDPSNLYAWFIQLDGDHPIAWIQPDPPPLDPPFERGDPQTQPTT